jgi:hypothetical protein
MIVKARDEIEWWKVIASKGGKKAKSFFGSS